MQTTTFTVPTGDRFACVDITAKVHDFCAGLGDGLCHVFVPHATCGLALMELGSGSERDAEAALEALLPRDERWVHRHGSPGHGADHLAPLLVTPFLVLPVVGSRPALGTWQSVALIDTNRDNATRTVRLSFVAGS